MDNLWGWSIALGSYGVFWLVLTRPDRRPVILIAGYLVLTAHHLLSWINVDYGPLIFARYDAWGFHLFAQKFAGDASALEWSIGTPMYKSMLLLLYDWLGKSLWLAQSFSVLFFAISMAALVRLLRRLEVIHGLLVALALLAYGLIPSGLMYGSITLREPFMTAFLILGCGLAARGLQEKRPVDIVFAGGCWLAVGLFHQIIMMYAFLISITLFVLYYWQNRQGGTILFAIPLIVLACLGVVFIWWLPSTGGDNYFTMLMTTIPESVGRYRAMADSSNPLTAYPATFSFTNWPQMFFSLLHSYIHYFSWPVMGDYSALWTWVVMTGALVRLSGLVAIILLWRDKRLWLLGLLFLSLSFLWNIGTTNYGQALRHHMMTDWLMIIAVVMFLQQRFFSRDGN